MRLVVIASFMIFVIVGQWKIQPILNQQKVLNLRAFRAAPKLPSLVKSYRATPNDVAEWSPTKLPDHLKDRDQHDPELIEHIRNFWIIPPFKGPPILKTNTDKPEPMPKAQFGFNTDWSQQGQPSVVNKILNNKSEGFYVECGAADGELSSNSLFFELYHHWDGILIEGNTDYFSKILSTKRRAFMLNACLSPTKKPQLLNFTLGGDSGGISNMIPPAQVQMRLTNAEQVEMQCFPLYSILAAMGVYHVDYFSLDVEGPELEILQTVPLDEMSIDIISVETRVTGDDEARIHKEYDLLEMTRPYGYLFVQKLKMDIVMSKVAFNASIII